MDLISREETGSADLWGAADVDPDGETHSWTAITFSQVDTM